MAEGLLTIGASATGSGLAAGLQKLTGADDGSGGQSVGSQIEDQINMMNKKLQQSLNTGLNYSQNYTNQAIGTQQQYLGQSTNALNNALATTTNQTQNSLLQGFNQSQALQSPYALMGYNASDAYMDSLGLARPKNGSANMAQTMNTAASAINPQLIQNLQQAATAAGQDPYAQGTAPTQFTDPRQSQAQLLQGLSPEMQSLYNNPDIAKLAANWKSAPPSLFPLIQQYQAAKSQVDSQKAAQEQQYNTLNTNYQQQQGLFNNYQGAQQSLLNSVQNLTPDQLKTALAYRSGSFNTPQVI